jgi:tetratricopeptide (TPR) repeat protein
MSTEVAQVVGDLARLDIALQSDSDNPDLLLERATLRRRLAAMKSDRELASRALHDVERVLRVRPNDHVAWLERGLTYYVLGQQDQAIADYDRSISIRPDARAYYNRGEARWKRTLVVHQGQHIRSPEAVQQVQLVLEDYAQAVSLQPSMTLAHFNRGVVFISVQDYRSAITEFDRGISIDPSDYLSYFNRALCWENLILPRYSNKSNLRRAIDDYTSLLQIAPDYLPAYFNRALCYEHVLPEGRYKSKSHTVLAIRDYDEILRRHPGEPVALYNRAWAFQNIGAIDEALEDFHKFQEVNTDGFMAGQLDVHTQGLQQKRKIVQRRVLSPL